MKRMIIAVSLLMGIAGVSFGQTTMTKKTTGKSPAKMSISAKENSGSVVAGAIPVAKKTTPANNTKTAGPAVKTNSASTAVKQKPATKPAAKKIIGKHHKAHKKIRKGNVNKTSPATTPKQ